MTPAEEDALVESCYAQTAGNGIVTFSAPSDDLIRLAIRAAVAAERERCAKCCVDLSACVFPHAKDYFIKCAAAIRRGP